MNCSIHWPSMCVLSGASVSEVPPDGLLSGGPCQQPSVWPHVLPGSSDESHPVQVSGATAVEGVACVGCFAAGLAALAAQCARAHLVQPASNLSQHW